MSTDDQGDTVSLNKEQRTSDDTPENSKNFAKNEEANSSSLKQDGDKNIDVGSDDNPSSSESEAFDGENEAIIEKKLHLTLDKAPDVDSELDFELKYEEDADDDLAEMDTDSLQSKAVITFGDEPGEIEGNVTKDFDNIQLICDRIADDNVAMIDTDALQSEAVITHSDKTGGIERKVKKDLDNIQFKYDKSAEDNVAKIDTDALQSEALSTPSDEPSGVEGNMTKDLDNIQLICDRDADDDVAKIEADAKQSDIVITPSDELDRIEGNVVKDLDKFQLEYNKKADHDITKMDTDAITPSEEPDKTEINTAKDLDNFKSKYDKHGNYDLAEMDTDAITPSDKPDRTEEPAANDLETVNAPQINQQVDDGRLVDSCSLNDIPLANTDKLPEIINKIDTDKKTDLSNKTSPVESETNSLDEHLVYSDVEVPEIEDNDLLDEIDAQIMESGNKCNDEKLEDEETITPAALPDIIQKLSNVSSSCKQDIDSIAMDVDLDITESISVKEEVDNLNDTMSSTNDKETSIFEINNEHGLAKPDVMIEIPTQGLIESLDDSGEMSDGLEQYDEDMLLNNDKTDTENALTNLVQGTEVSTNDNEVIIEKNILNEVNISDKNTLLSAGEHNKDEIAIESSKQTDIEIDTKHIEIQNKTSEIMNKTDIEDMFKVGNSNEVDITESGEDNIEHKHKDITDKANIADIILEATTLKPKEPKAVTETENIDSHNKVQSKQDTEAKQVTSTAELSKKTVLDEESTTPDTSESQVQEAKDVTSNDLEPKEVKETPVSSTDKAQPSTSKYLLQELSDEDQEVTDSLGLLAESSRVMDDDDEQEQDQDPEDDDEDDDFDQDDESNQLTAEHSEDSNAQQSESDVPRELMDAEESPTTDKEAFQFQIAEVVSAKDVDALAETVEQEADENNEADATEVEKAVQALLGETQAEGLAGDVSPKVDIAEEGTVRLPEESEGDGKQKENSKLRTLLLQNKEAAATTTAEHMSPSKVKKLEVVKPKHEISIVDLEESSSEDDIQEVNKQPVAAAESAGEVSVNIPDEVEVMSASSGAMSGLRRAPGEYVISVPKPPPTKPARLNTSEVSIKTAVVATEPLAITDKATPTQDKTSLKFGLEIFSLDSDDDEKTTERSAKKLTAVELERARESNKCINVYCARGGSGPLLPADARCAAYYNSARRGAVCLPCALAVAARTQNLIDGVKDFRPLLSLDMGQTKEDLVEISDSESEEEPDFVKEADDVIGEAGAKFLEANLEDMFNVTWRKFNMDARLLEAQGELDLEVKKLEAECSEIDTMLVECQTATDCLRRDLYDSFAHERRELPAILIYDTPPNAWSGLEDGILAYENKEPPRQSKRRLAASAEPPAKRPAIPLGYAPLDGDANTAQSEPKAPSPAAADVAAPNDDDSADISVVRQSAEAAPAGLPAPGALVRGPLRAGLPVYAMRNAYGAWLRARILDVQPATPATPAANQFTMCRVKFDHKVKNPCKVLPARCLAYDEPAAVRMTIGTRVIALFKGQDNKRESFYSGIIAEIPNPVNSYRYLVFFDDGYAQYAAHAGTRLVCECAPLVWDEVHPFSRQFVRDYLRAFPERPMVRAHAGQSLKTEYNGKWWVSKVVKVDASLVQVHFEEENRFEWIYRGSTRLAPLFLELQAAERQRARPLPRAQPGRRFNMPYVEYTRSEEPAPPAATTPQQIEQEIRRQRAVAKKSTALPAAPAPAPLDGVTSRVVFYTPKNAIRPHKMVPHTCGPKCRRTDVLALKDLRTYNPLTKPLLSGWERQIVKYRWSRGVMYRAPCGRRVRGYRELHRYLQAVRSEMAVDLFDFGVNTHCLAEFVLNKCLISKKDLSNGRENVPVPCVNYYDESLPEFCSYNTERTPTAGVPLNLDPEFLCGCDCTDDCADKSKCACWKMTLEGARTIGLDTSEVGYVYKRLPEPLPSGIYECNSRCKCRQTCLNRVAQHPLQLKLQVFKTLNRGWGIRALNDVPKGAFLCVYAGNLLTDATANLDGLNEGDEYLAELDYIEVVEQMKEGFEEDIPDEDKKLDKKESDSPESSSSVSSSSEEEDERKDEDDDDFRPTGPVRSAISEYSKRLRKRDKAKKKEGQEREKQKEKEGSLEDNCITISDDEELREPARFSAQAVMGGKEFISKHKSVRAHFGKDEACYIMDAKVQGNIGRYLNHSCTPNVFVQNVFVDTHDPRFPWVAFFALAHIRAGTELTWNYNYDVGSVPGKVLYCHCAAPNCRGRLL